MRVYCKDGGSGNEMKQKKKVTECDVIVLIHSCLFLACALSLFYHAVALCFARSDVPAGIEGESSGFVGAPPARNRQQRRKGELKIYSERCLCAVIASSMCLRLCYSFARIRSSNGYTVEHSAYPYALLQFRKVSCQSPLRVSGVHCVHVTTPIISSKNVDHVNYQSSESRLSSESQHSAHSSALLLSQEGWRCGGHVNYHSDTEW